jgi:hypothetical protein
VKHFQARIFLLMVAVMAIGPVVYAKDLTHRLGLGFKNNTSVSIPSLAGVYFYSKELAFTASLGLDTQKNASTFQASGGARYILFFENNMNAYVSGQFGLINAEDATGKASGVEMLGTGGVEFFFTGLENLGFTIEAGLGLSTVRNTRMRTVADDPLRAGFTFYF